VLRSRTARDVTAQYPEIHMIHELVDQVNAVIDGEIVAFDPDGRISFETLQQRMNLANPRQIERIKTQIPVTFVAFDLLWLDGKDTTGLGLEERRELLTYVVEQDDRLQLTAYVEGEGTSLVEAARQQTLEGVVAKRKGSPYVPGRRTDAWRKIKIRDTQDCVILGFTPGQGGRGSTFGAVLVGAYTDGTLRWIGQAGSGFTEQMLETLLEKLTPLVRRTPPIDDPELARVKGAVFVEPKVVCEIEYTEITRGTKKMRAPVFKGIRDDKLPEDCVLEPAVGSSR
jgi:bifunctional non-homologous end joining protein LigD